jgi:hypothetical protein
MQGDQAAMSGKGSIKRVATLRRAIERFSEKLDIENATITDYLRLLHLRRAMGGGQSTPRLAGWFE